MKKFMKIIPIAALFMLLGSAHLNGETSIYPGPGYGFRHYKRPVVIVRPMVGPVVIVKPVCRPRMRWHRRCC